MAARGGDAVVTSRAVRGDRGTARPGVPACADALFAGDWTGDRPTTLIFEI
jgi:hypothetical protein